MTVPVFLATSLQSASASCGMTKNKTNSLMVSRGTPYRYTACDRGNQPPAIRDRLNCAYFLQITVTQTVLFATATTCDLIYSQLFATCAIHPLQNTGNIYMDSTETVECSQICSKLMKSRNIRQFHCTLTIPPTILSDLRHVASFHSLLS